MAFLVLVSVDQLSMIMGATTTQRIWDDLAGGFVVGLLLFFEERRRRRYLAQRLEVIALMNHHVRNALQVIKYAHYSADELKIIEESVARIEWALREILPGKNLDATAARTSAPAEKQESRQRAS